MGFWKSIFGGEKPEESRQREEAKNFDILKYDGIRAQRMGRIDYALRCYDEALKLKDDFEILSNKAGVLIGTNRLEEALEVLGRMAELEPDVAETYIAEANIHYMLERYEDMKDAAEQAVRCDSGNAAAHFLVGRAEHSLERPAEAIEALGKALALQGGYTEARNLRAEIYQQTGQTAKALDDIAQVLSAHPDEESALSLRAYIYNKVEHDAAKAEADYRHIIDVNPFSRQAYTALASLLRETARPDEAARLEEEAAALLPEADAEAPDYKIGGMEKRDVLGL